MRRCEKISHVRRSFICRSIYTSFFMKNPSLRRSREKLQHHLQKQDISKHFRSASNPLLLAAHWWIAGGFQFPGLHICSCNRCGDRLRWFAFVAGMPWVSSTLPGNLHIQRYLNDKIFYEPNRSMSYFVRGPHLGMLWTWHLPFRSQHQTSAAHQRPGGQS